MRKSRKLMIGCKRKRDARHKELRLAVRLDNWFKIYCSNCVSQPICKI